MLNEPEVIIMLTAIIMVVVSDLISSDIVHHNTIRSHSRIGSFIEKGHFGMLASWVKVTVKTDQEAPIPTQNDPCVGYPTPLVNATCAYTKPNTKSYQFSSSSAVSDSPWGFRKS
jgi:hypothetical protein